jgi:pilus assembly protein CpaB
MRKTSLILPLILALAFGVIASVLVLSFIRSQLANKGPNLQTVVVASKDLTFGETLTGDNMKTAMYPEGSIPKGAFGIIDSLLGEVTKVFLKENEPILESKLSSKGGGLSLLISKDKRASSIQVDKVSGVSGFILPGDKVDVIASIDRYGSGQDAVAKTLLQNVEVLAAGEKTEQKGDKVITVQSVTLLVDPDGAQALALASKEGKLNLALRNPVDDAIVSVDPISKKEITEGKKKSTPPPRTRPRVREITKTEPTPKPDSLVIIKGGVKKMEAPAMETDKGT